MDANSTPREFTEAEKNQLFTNEAGTIINWAGENFYKACDTVVHENPEGGATCCVLRVDHPAPLHEDFYGQTLFDLDSEKSSLEEVTHEATQ